MARLTAKTNGEWDFNSLEGKLEDGLVCHTCGEIVTLTYDQVGYGERYGCAIYGYCLNCFSGSEKTALTTQVGS